MKVVKCVVLLVLVSLTSLSASAKNPFDDVVNSISSALKTGTSKGISATFMNSVSLSIKRDERVYTRFQAELLLDDFFSFE